MGLNVLPDMVTENPVIILSLEWHEASRIIATFVEVAEMPVRVLRKLRVAKISTRSCSSESANIRFARK